MAKPTKVLICTKGKSCRKAGSKDLFCSMQQTIENLGLEKDITLKKTDCMGYCGSAPIMKIKGREKLFYSHVSPEDIREIIWSLVSGTPIERLRLKKKAS